MSTSVVDVDFVLDHTAQIVHSGLESTPCVIFYKSPNSAQQ